MPYAICIEGEHIEFWGRLLGASSDPYLVSDNRGRHFLRSRDLDSAGDNTAASAIGEPLVARLNGLVAAHHGFRPVKVVGPASVQSDGSMAVSHRLIAEVGAFSIFTATLAGGGRPAVLELADKLQRYPFLDDASAFYGKANGWFELYYMIEALCRHAGSEKEFKQSGWGGGVDLGLIKQTANFHRHAYVSRPPTELRWEAAYKMAGRVLIDAIKSAP